MRKDLILEAMLAALFGSVLTVTLEPLLRSFTHQFTIPGIPIDVLPVLGIGSIIGLTVMAVLLILRLINYRKNKDPSIMIIQATPKTNLNELIKEIEDFTIKWQEGSGVLSGYRKWIENNRFVGDKNQIRKFMKHGEDIHSKINRVKKVRIYELDSALNGLVQVTDRLIKLLVEIKRVYWNMDKSKLILKSDPNISKK